MTDDFYDLFKKPDPTPRPTGTVTPIDPARATRYATKALTAECANVAGAGEGQRNHTLNAAAFSIGQLVAAGHLTETDAVDNLTAAARTAGLDETEIHATIRSGLGAGAREPRVVPEQTPTDLPAVTPLVPAQAATEPDEAEEVDPFARFNLINWQHLKDTDDTPEQWLAEPIIAAGRMTALYSAPKAGKSLLVLEVVADIALGRPVLGHPANDPVSVLYVDFENDPRGDIKPRLEDMGHDLTDLTGRLHVATFPTMARLDTAQGGLDLLILAQHVGARLVVIDTVSRTVSGEENDNNTWLAFYRNTGLLLKREGIACLRLDHSGKDVERGMRGGSAKYGDVDAVWRLVAASETVLELTCTDHRMPLDTTAFTVVRHTDPLRHEVAGDPFAVALDAKERDLIATLERLQVPRDWGRRKIRETLKAAGVSAENTLLTRTIKARKMILVDTNPNVSGHVADTCPQPTSDTACPEPPIGGRTADTLDVSASATDTAPEQTHDPELDLVSCTACYRPIEQRLARVNNGRCTTCSTTTSPTLEETP